ncbi:hypothetical protein HK100_009814 [Physocladia obscura]|uniref:Chitinase n=1 Tax=Physocladia obscura TaxID=109957 RepID=A0AAD5T3K7_9FUNG|nr:hypothetical protein HK100_009814 [Physocladia obscura]
MRSFTGVLILIAGLAQAVTFAPYINVGAQDGFSVTNFNSLSGATSFTLAFVTADVNGNPTWNGISATSGYFSSQAASIRSLGGDYRISFGGAAGTELALVATSAASLATKYLSVINAYSAVWADFDVEGTTITNRASVDLRNQAIKLMQAQNPNLKVSYTIPSWPTGLDTNGAYLLQSAKTYGARIDVLNIMTMDFYQSAVDVNGKTDMGTNIIAAAQVIYGQYGSYFGSLGITPMIGINDDTSEIVTLANVAQVTAWVKTVNYISLVAFWDTQLDLWGNADGQGATPGAYAKAFVQGLSASSSGFAFQSGNNGAVMWASGCDWTGGDIANVLLTSQTCGSACVNYSGCTHFSWTSYNSGTCWLKNNSVGSAVALTGAMCGYTTA